ncbi:MAG: bifunctional UDP-N-acetylmuramoyl-tripeptide:D-alanyl-D-alanine ligase/alanine racemase [Bacteroidia bacterium]|jgi:alanine racemase|nr:bifunctional UDP-N-acetylmuramoyl-tripeptide:D-alanyl-D-alanine ligase/alanine racemase [Bacteroidia bacterium]
MNYRFSDIARILNAAPPAADGPVQHLLIDSRNTAQTEAAVFFAIRGERHNGHSFIADLYTRGIRFFIVSEMPDAAAFPDAGFIRVPDTLTALQDLAAHHRKQFHFPVIAITGSNGKTIVKEWLWQLLRDDYRIVRSPKSYNSQVGVPLSVWQMSEEHTLGIFEAGISRTGEMQRLQHILQPDVALLTNIGPAHDENFVSREQKTHEKLKLLEGASLIISGKDDAATYTLLATGEGANTQRFSWSRKSKATLQLADIKRDGHETELKGVYDHRFVTIRIPFTDEASIENAIHCWCVLLHFGLSDETIAARMKQLTPVAMRLEMKEGVSNCSVINDSYNSDLGSLSVALDFLNQQQQHPKRTLILSDILQSGRNEAQLYGEVAALLQAKGIHRLIGIGSAIGSQQQLFAVNEKQFFATTRDFLAAFHVSQFHDETILIKGARAFGFEAISKVLQQKAHETVLEIDLNAVVHNLNYFRSRIHPGTKIMAMVKAFSYGSGSFEIANVLQYHRVDYLAVAYADEGVELRRAGITLPVMVMNPEEQSYETMIRYQLEPEIFSFRILQLFDEVARRYRQRHPETPPVPVHIKLDTGMRRLGFEQSDINELVVRLKNAKDLTVRSVFSHLAASDEAEHDGFTNAQIKQFIAMSDVLRSHFTQPVFRHILNSAGIVRFPDAQFECVRLGVGLYGVGVDADEQKRLRQIGTLRTTISQIKNVPAGETVGYSRKGKTTHNTRTATVPIGYADGLSRKLSNGRGCMWINGKPAYIIGNVCMDMCMLDVTDIDCEEGDEVIVFSPDHPIGELAQAMETIPYEVLTNVSGRVKRVYYQE